MEPKLTQLNRISMKADSRLNERWLQEKLIAQPELLGLGDVVQRDKERTQPSGGPLAFTKVLDHRALEAPDEAVAAPADRQFWEARASTASLQFTDKLLEVLNNISESQQFTLNYNRAYIGLVNTASQTVMNLVYLRPRKKHVLVEAKCKQDSSLTELLDDSSLDFMDYRSKHGCYRCRVADVDRLDEDAQELVKLLLKRALSENT